MPDHPVTRWGSVASAAAAVVLMSAAFVVGSTPDEEEFRFAILSTWLHVQALAQGVYAWWTPALGLGVPLPLSPNFHWHPLAPLLAVVSPIAWTRILLVSHAVLGTAGMWQLTRRIGVSPPARAVAVLTFLLATPPMNYTLTDFWPSHFVVWTSGPWLVLLAWRLCESEPEAAWRRGAALGLCLGLVVANTNPGHIIVYSPLAAAIVAVHRKGLSARWQGATMAVVIAAAIALPNLLQLAHERRQFDAGMGRSSVADPLPLAALWHAVLSPLPPPDTAVVDTPFTRMLFFGGPFTVMCLVGGLQAIRRHSDLALTVVASATLLFTTLTAAPFVSARFQFRDPLILSAVPLAAMAVDRLAVRSKPVAAFVLVLQAGVVLWTAAPFLNRTWTDEGRSAFWFRGATGQGADRLVSLMASPGRLLVSPDVDREIMARDRLPEGLGINALAYRGVHLVNGWFKGVSTGTVWPDERLFYGRIRVPLQITASDAALDVLAVRYVLANEHEPVAGSLRMVGAIEKSDDTRFVLYENADVWPDGFLVDDAAGPLDLPAADGCAEHALLCRNFDSLVARRLDTPLRVRERIGTLDVRVLPAATPRTLIVSQMYRPHWVATAGDRRLATMPAAGALLAVRVPPNVARIELRYRPSSLIAATGLAWGTLLFGSVVAIARPRWIGRHACRRG